MRHLMYSSSLTPDYCWVGGCAPAGVVPSYDVNRQKFFGVFPLFHLGVTKFFSVFYSLSMDGSVPERDIIDHNNRVLKQGELIHLVVHEQLPPAGSLSRTDISYHCLTVSAEVNDEVGEENGVYSSPTNKIGGCPFSFRGSLSDTLFAGLARDGYRQILQFVTPHPVRESFVVGCPWDPGSLHVFMRGDIGGDCMFSFVIQQ